MNIIIVKRFLLSGLVLASSIVAAGCSGSSSPPTKTPANTQASPAISPAAGAGEEVSYPSGKETIYGSLQVPPQRTSRLPAVLIIAGSGPSDRDGNSKLIKGSIDTLRHFADVAAADGVVSLRYDKLGTGRTGIGSFASHPADIGFEVYIQEATDALAYLRSRPEVDPSKIAILGHSEGGLIALIVAQRAAANDTPAALVLAAPLATNELELVARQLSGSAASGAIPAAQATALTDQLTTVVASLEKDGHYPPDIASYSAALRPIFTPANEHFFADMSKVNGLQIAAKLSPTLPVLIMRGTKDQQIFDDDIQALTTAFRAAGNSNIELDELPDTDHVFKVVSGTPDATKDYTNPALPFSPEADTKLAAFLHTTLR